MFPLLILLLVSIAVPITCAVYLWRFDALSRTAWLIAFSMVVAVVLLIFLVGRWDIVGVYTRYILGVLIVAAGLSSLRRHLRRPWWVAHRSEIFHRHLTSLVSLVLLGGALFYVLTGIFLQPAAHAMKFPLAGGRFVVGQGGNNSLLNYHHSHRAQRYAADITAVNAVGFRAAGLLPRDLPSYAIFGARVSSPCDGIIISSVDGLPDQIPPIRDRANARGNHVSIACGGLRVELVHLKKGSVSVRAGERVVAGRQVGQVGNSGNTVEPHLHVHAVDAATNEGVPLSFDGIAPVRNRIFAR